MADFNLEIAEKAFAHIGVRPRFDEDMYGRLLDYALESSGVTATPSVPTVRLVPNPKWGSKHEQHLLQEVLTGKDGIKNGTKAVYDCEDDTVTVRCTKDAEDANLYLRHETKHWADWNAGIDLVGQKKIMRRQQLAVIVATPAVAIAEMDGIYTLSKESIAGAAIAIAAMLPTVVAGTVTAPHWIYKKSPHEKSARRFQNDPAVRAMFGKVVSYEAL